MVITYWFTNKFFGIGTASYGIEEAFISLLGFFLPVIVKIRNRKLSYNRKQK